MEFNRINDNLVLGSVESLKDEDLMKNITAVMTVFDHDLPDGYEIPNDVHHWHLWIDDDDTPENGEQMASYFLPSAVWLAVMMQNDCDVLVHCMLGVSRSATILTSYLMLHHGWDTEMTLEHVRKRHCWASPNKEFLKQLATLEGVNTKANNDIPILDIILGYLN